MLVPKFRHNYDITIPEDLVEEIGRTRGYDTIQVAPLLAEVKTPIRNLSRELEKKCKTFFSGSLGYHEVFNYSFQSLKENELDGDPKLSVKIKNEMPEEQSFLRNSLLPSLLKIFEPIRIVLGRLRFLNLAGRILIFRSRKTKRNFCRLRFRMTEKVPNRI